MSDRPDRDINAPAPVERAYMVCPSCKSGRLCSKDMLRLECSSCGSVYPYRGQLVDLLPEKTSHRSIAQLFMESRLVTSVYESRLWRRNPIVELFLGISFEKEYAAVMNAAGLRDGSTVFDLACGPGIYTRRMARNIPNGTIFGLDLSMPMLEYAARKSFHERLGNCMFIHSDASRIPFENECADAVICCGALHLMPDPRHTVMEAGRVLKPGGRFVAAVFYDAADNKGSYIVKRAASLIGVNAFSLDRIEEYFLQAGFTDIKCPRAKGLWLVIAGVKH